MLLFLWLLVTDLKEILAKSRNYAELEHVWLSWRDASGKKLLPLYPQYVQLLNEASEYNRKLLQSLKYRIYLRSFLLTIVRKEWDLL